MFRIVSFSTHSSNSRRNQSLVRNNLRCSVLNYILRLVWLHLDRSHSAKTMNIDWQCSKQPIDIFRIRPTLNVPGQSSSRGIHFIRRPFESVSGLFPGLHSSTQFGHNFGYFYCRYKCYHKSNFLDVNSFWCSFAIFCSLVEYVFFSERIFRATHVRRPAIIQTCRLHWWICPTSSSNSIRIPCSLSSTIWRSLNLSFHFDKRIFFF